MGKGLSTPVLMCKDHVIYLTVETISVPYINQALFITHLCCIKPCKSLLREANKSRCMIFAYHDLVGP